jgi:Zn-dependent protease with chaperone function
VKRALHEIATPVPVVQRLAACEASRFPISLTDAEEIEAGEMMARDFMRQEGMEPTPQTKKLEAYLQAVGRHIAAHAQRNLPYKFRYDPSPGFKSAVGFPGGQIFVGAGILTYMDTEDQLAMVLGHEIEHIALNQCHDRSIKVMTDGHLTPDDFTKLKVDPFLDGYGHDGEFVPIAKAQFSP